MPMGAPDYALFWNLSNVDPFAFVAGMQKRALQSVEAVTRHLSVLPTQAFAGSPPLESTLTLTYVAKSVISDRVIRSFADFSLDYQELHLKDDFARKTMFNGRIAHGCIGDLVNWYESNRVFGDVMQRGEMVKQVRFKAPVRPGDEITAVLKESAYPSGERRIDASISAQQLVSVYEYDMKQGYRPHFGVSGLPWAMVREQDLKESQSYRYEDLSKGMKVFNRRRVDEEMVQALYDTLVLLGMKNVKAAELEKMNLNDPVLTAIYSNILGMQLTARGSVYAEKKEHLLWPVYLGDTLTSSMTVTNLVPKIRGVALEGRTYNQLGTPVAEFSGFVRLDKCQN